MERIREDDLKLVKKYFSLYTSALNRNIHFDMSLAHLKRMMKRKTCYYTGVKFDDIDEIRSIERVDNEKGYTDENTVAVSERINMAKNNFTESDLKLILKAIQKHKKHMNQNGSDN